MNLSAISAVSQAQRSGPLPTVAGGDPHLASLLQTLAAVVKADYASLYWRPHRGLGAALFCSTGKYSETHEGAACDLVATNPFPNVICYPLGIGAQRDWTLKVGRVGMAFSAEDLERFHLCKSLFRAGFKSWRRADIALRRVKVMEGLVGVLDCGVLVVDPQSRIVFANDRAKELLAFENGLVEAGNYLSSRGLENTIRLQSILQQALTSNTKSGHVEKGALATIERFGAGRLSIAAACVAPAIGDTRPLVALYIVDPLRDLTSATAFVCKTRGLTPTEARLVQHLATGDALAEACVRMRIQPQTGRTYLRQIFNKLGICRQADLMRVILTALLPIRVLP